MGAEERGSGGNAVPIVAIVAGALVGMVSPVAIAVVARRTKRELEASAARQRAALDAERDRLQTTLDAEGQRQRREVERSLLDHGTMLISDFRDAMADVKLDQRGRPVITDRWRRAAHAISAFRGRLLLWFDEASDVVAAFDAVTVFTAWNTTWLGELRAGERKVRITRGLQGGSVDAPAGASDYALEDVDVTHLRYVIVARAHLRD